MNMPSPGAAALLARLEAIFREVLEDETIHIDAGMKPGDLPGWDSFSNVSILLACEQVWQFQFSSAQIDAIRSVADLVRTIDEKLR